ncbi:hypothetical protein MRX96_024363 [Rhipicephalus microplus]
MSLKHAWLILQMVPLVLSAPTSTDKVPALPRLFPTASRGVMGANLWDWKTSVTSPCEEDIKPRPLQRHLSGSGGATAAMSLKHAWLILQMVPLVLSAPTSTDKVPALPRLFPTASRGVMGANLWDWKTSVTSPCEEDIKPRPLQRHLSGSGGATAAMSLKHAWLILQMVPLVLSAPTSTDKVPALPRLFPTASRGVMGGQPMGLEDFGDVTMRRRHKTSPASAAPQWERRRYSSNVAETCVAYLADGAARAQCSNIDRQSPGPAQIIPDSIPWRHGGQPMGLEDFGDVTMRRRHKTSPASAAPQWERRRYSSNVAETCVAYLADGAARAQCSNIDRQSPGPAQIIPDSIPWRHGGPTYGTGRLR